MFTVTVVFKVKAGLNQGFLTLMRSAISATKQEPGNIEYLLSVDESDSQRYILQEIYQNRQAYEAHTETEHLAQLRTGLTEFLSQPPTVYRGTAI